MSQEVSFQLFGDGGFINPTPWSYAATDPSRKGARWGLCFYDSNSMRFYQKQASDFDGGWRWFEPSYEADALCIYNVKLDRRAYTHITRIEIVDTVIGPEFILMCAKSRVILEHNIYTSLEYVLDSIRAMAHRARTEIMRERGDDYLHSV